MRPSFRLAVVLVASIVGVVGAWLVGDRTVVSLVALVLSIGGAGLAAYLVRGAPVAAFGVVFVLAAISRLTVELPPGTMRLEQPAIAAVLLALAADRRISSRPRRAALPVVGGLGLFLATLALSSVIVAPEPAASLRFAAWYAISIAGGLVAFLLLRGRAQDAMRWLAGVGAAAGVPGILVAVLFLVVGESWTLGIQGAPDAPRVYAIAWEGNIYASFLVALLPFAIERFRLAPSGGRGAAILVIVLGFALAITRGAYLGLAVGIPLQFLALVYAGRPWRSVAAPAGVVLACVVASALAPTILLPSNRPPPAVVTPAATPGGPAEAGSQGPGGVVSSGAPTTPQATPVVTPRPYPDTIGYRLARVPPALGDLSTSPVIGLGADSFGQRHTNEQGAPDHIGILAIALPYDAGLLGALGFAVATAWLLLMLVRCLRGPGATPAAAAYLGSLVSLLVAYQATNAIHFAMNWLIAGAAAAVVADVTRTRPEASHETGR